MTDNLSDYSKFIVYEKKYYDKEDECTYTQSIRGLQFKIGYIHKNIDFNEFDKKETKIPAGYKKTDFSESWKLSYYCDPNKNRVQKEAKDKHEGCDIYLTLDNGGSPFAVYHGSKVHIYKIDSEKYYVHDKDWDDEKTRHRLFTKHVVSYDPVKVFIGTCPNYGHPGNSILLQLSDKKYVYIGEKIKTFTTVNKIVEYSSEIGNSSVPYPYAVDVRGRHYLIIEDVIVNKLPQCNKDPYQYYYEHILITKTNIDNIENVMIIHDRIM